LDNLRRVQESSRGRVAIMPKWHPPFGRDEWIDLVRPEAVEIDADELTAEIAGVFHRKGVKVQAKTLGQVWDRPEVWDRVISDGADWIQTDLPEEVVSRALGKRLPARRVQISLHRGASRYAPENTLPAFEKALRLGADFIEFDVRTSKDGQFFLLHDATLNRTTTGTGQISATEASVLAGLDAGAWSGRPFAGVKVPSLEEFLTAVRGKVELYCDAKAIPVETLAAILEKHQAVEHTVVYQNAGYLKKLKEINPRIRRLPPLGDPKQLEELAAELKPYAVDVNWRILSPELIRRCHDLEIRVFADSLGPNESIAEYQKVIKWGMDLIQTDHPMRVLRALELLHGTETKKGG
jgi:glycerophosphoryl diester phosphodiesterase